MVWVSYRPTTGALKNEDTEVIRSSELKFAVAIFHSNFKRDTDN